MALIPDAFICYDYNLLLGDWLNSGMFDTMFGEHVGFPMMRLPECEVTQRTSVWTFPRVDTSVDHKIALRFTGLSAISAYKLQNSIPVFCYCLHLREL